MANLCKNFSLSKTHHKRCTQSPSAFPKSQPWANEQSQEERPATPCQCTKIRCTLRRRWMDARAVKQCREVVKHLSINCGAIRARSRFLSTRVTLKSWHGAQVTTRRRLQMPTRRSKGNSGNCRTNNIKRFWVSQICRHFTHRRLTRPVNRRRQLAPINPNSKTCKSKLTR